MMVNAKAPFAWRSARPPRAPRRAVFPPRSAPMSPAGRGARRPGRSGPRRTQLPAHAGGAEPLAQRADGRVRARGVPRGAGLQLQAIPLRPMRLEDDDGDRLVRRRRCVAATDVVEDLLPARARVADEPEALVERAI